MKTGISSLCIALFLIINCSIWAYADGEIYTEGSLYYTVNGDSITIVGCFGDGIITVPAAIAGTPVNTIASGAFSDSQWITAVNLPDTITSIESGAIADGISYNISENAAVYIPEESIECESPKVTATSTQQSAAAEEKASATPRIGQDITLTLSAEAVNANVYSSSSTYVAGNEGQSMPAENGAASAPETESEQILSQDKEDVASLSTHTRSTSSLETHGTAKDYELSLLMIIASSLGIVIPITVAVAMMHGRKHR